MMNAHKMHQKPPEPCAVKPTIENLSLPDLDAASAVFKACPPRNHEDAQQPLPSVPTPPPASLPNHTATR